MKNRPGAKAMTCTHDLAERETACADGMCPLCMVYKIKRLIAEGERLRALVMEAINLAEEYGADAMKIRAALEPKP